MAADTAFASFMELRTQPFSVAQVSTENLRLISVAVVITGVAFKLSAIFRASALAPPMWPDSSGITKVPNSSTQTTAGSVRLSWTKGAIFRTAMPQEPTKTKTSEDEKHSP